MRGRRSVWVWPTLAGLVMGVVALGPALRPGFVLRYDMVFVPDPPVTWSTGGFPRAMPSDLVVALLSHVVPAVALQKLILIGIFLLAATGAAALVPGDRLVPRLATAVFYTWNVYLAQRLLLGQWALLLGYAGLPWAVRAVAWRGPAGLGAHGEGRGGLVVAEPVAGRGPIGGSIRGLVAGFPWRLVVAMIPAAVGGFQAMLVTALAVVPVAATHPHRTSAGSSAVAARLRGTAMAVAVLAVLSLPWAVPALLSHAVTDPAGVDAFAARADGPFGTLGSLLSLGGIWNREAGVPGQAAWLLATVRLVIAAASVYFFVRLGRSAGIWPEGGRAGGSRPEREDAPPYRWGLLVAAGTGLVIALVGAYAPGVLKALIELWPGFGPLRDGQLYIAPLVLVTAIGFGALVGYFSAPARRATTVPGVEPGTSAGLPAVDGTDQVRAASRRRGAESTCHGGGEKRRRRHDARVGGIVPRRRVALPVVVPGVVGILAPVLVLPAFAWGAAGRLAAVEYPAEWRRVQAIVNGDPRPGALVSLPWGAHRAFAWNGGRVILDPATKAFARRVVWNDSLTVGVGGGRILRVAGEDALSRRIGALLGTRDDAGDIGLNGARGADGDGAGRGAVWNDAGAIGGSGAGGVGGDGSREGGAVGDFALTGVLRAEGVRYVLVVGRNENTLRSRLVGATPVYVGREMLLLRL